MELGEVLARRRMVRRYLPDPVDEAVLRRILDRARRAPSAGHSQGQRFVVITDTAMRHRIAELCDEPRYVASGRQPWLSVAPVHVVVCVRPGDYVARYAEPDKAAARGPQGWTVPFWWVDGGAALMLLLLAAVDEGLGAGLLDVGERQETLRALLAIPSDVLLLGLATIGHPAPGADTPVGSATRPRRPFEDSVRFGRW